MNRQILFRGFHECDNGGTGIIVGGKKKRGEWLYGSYSPYNWTFGGTRKDEPQIIIHDENSDNDGLWADVIPSTVGQFTGLCDKNGKKIFEQDIMTESCYGKTVKIVFGDGEFYGDGGTYGRRISSLSEDEVISNAFETDLIGGDGNG